MTDAQKRWLDAHPSYRPTHPVCGHFKFVGLGWLHENGRFDRSASAPGAFKVGKLTETVTPPSDEFVPLR